MDDSKKVEDLEEEEDEDAKYKEKLAMVQRGCLEDLPPLSSKIVRIFTSSTFTDTQNERNTLMSTTYPKLKEYCREKHGLEFQVVDMRWGVRDEATDDHKTSELCMTEIANCQRLSVGPNFCVFLGQKYGYRPVPTFIMGAELDMFKEVIKEDPEDLECLEKWYLRDANAVPSQYILQPISTYLANFNNKRMQRMMEADQNEWWCTMLRLQKMLRKSAQVLFLAKKITRDEMHNYFMSVTEREVRNGIINAKDTKDHCLGYLRTISNINLSALRFARNFIDMAGRDVDEEAVKLLSVLRDEILPTKLVEANVTRFEIEWTGREGIDKESHRDYLKDFCELFHDQITEQVDRAMEANLKLAGDKTYSEALQHLHAAKNSCKTFQGREEVVERIRQYILKPEFHLPLVLSGRSGCGKTSLLAKGFSMVKTWWQEEYKVEPIMILRFLGTSPDSSSIIPLLTSVCRQICFNYDISPDDIPEELSPLVMHFKGILSVGSAEKPLVIYLDSLDQLSPADGAHSLTWIPIQLPDYCKFVVSTLPDYYGLLDTLEKFIEPKEQFIEVKPLGQNLGSSILKSWLKLSNRTVTEYQWGIVQEALEKCNLPLFVKLVFDEIRKWSSYTDPKNTSLSHSIHDSIFKLFEKVEKCHGKMLVSRALAYVTASKSGLSESELEDLLSLDEKVLNDVYQYHLPPTRRIPPLLWTRIRADLPNYFSEREADGANVIDWYHRQFIEASRDRYFRNVNVAEELHSNIADYFLGMWGGGIEKPFEYSDLQRTRFNLDSKKGLCDRKVPPMPLYYTNHEGKIIRFNLRKLSELPFNLIRAKRHDDLYKEVLFNIRWLHAKLSCQPLQAVMADFEDALSNKYDKDVKLLEDALRLSASVLSRDAGMVGPNIVGRLLPYYTAREKIRSLIKQCDTDGLEMNALSPSFHCMHTPGGPLQFSLEGHPFAPFGIEITSDNRYLISVSNLFIIWDLATGDVHRQLNAPGIQGIMQSLCLTPDDKFCVCYTNSNQIVTLSVITGEIKLHNLPPGAGKDPISGCEATTTHMVLWSKQEYFLYTLSGELIKQDKLKEDGSLMIWIGLVEDSEERFLVWKNEKPIAGVESDEEMALEIHGTDVETFYFHSAIALTRDRCTMYTCIAISDDAVVCYKRNLGDNKWSLDRNFGNNFDKIFCLTLSKCEKYLVATLAFKYKLWDLEADVCLDLKLPNGVRNIPNKNTLFGFVVFTLNSEYLVAGVRKNLYVWTVKDGELVKTLDAHFGRIINIKAVTSPFNKIVSSSIDKSIKVWNWDNINEDVFSIDRMEKPIDAVSLASNAYVGATTTRGCVGIWNLESGKLMKQLANSAMSSIVTHSVINADAGIVCSAESGNILVWDVEKEKILKSDTQRDVQQMFLADDDSKVVTFSKGMSGKGKCVARGLPKGETIFQFDYNMKKFKNAVVTADSMFLVVPAINAKGNDILTMYHAKTGTLLNDIPLKYLNYKEFHTLVPIPNDSHQVALIDDEKGNIFDIKKKALVRSIQRWNGKITSNGKYGLFAPNRGGLELLDLKTGKTVHTLIPRVAEGVFSNVTLFTKNDQHVVYYHSGKRSIRVFRVSDGKQIADYKAHAELKAIASTQYGVSIVLGAVDGSVVVLTIADPIKEANKEYLASLPSRQIEVVDTAAASSSKGNEKSETDANTNGTDGKSEPAANGTTTPNGATATNGTTAPNGTANGAGSGSTKFATVAKVARLTAKAKTAQKSRACVIQ